MSFLQERKIEKVPSWLRIVPRYVKLVWVFKIQNLYHKSSSSFDYFSNNNTFDKYCFSFKYKLDTLLKYYIDTIHYFLGWYLIFHLHWNERLIFFELGEVQQNVPWKITWNHSYTNHFSCCYNKILGQRHLRGE